MFRVPPHIETFYLIRQTNTEDMDRIFCILSLLCSFTTYNTPLFVYGKRTIHLLNVFYSVLCVLIVSSVVIFDSIQMNDENCQLLV